MATAKFTPPKKAVARKEVSSLSSAMASPYNIFIPIKGAGRVWIKHPERSGMRNLPVNGDEFYGIMLELFTAGFGTRINQELAEFATIDPKWNTVNTQLAEKLATMGYTPPLETANA